jgi:hypothetical protein
MIESKNQLGNQLESQVHGGQFNLKIVSLVITLLLLAFGAQGATIGYSSGDGVNEYNYTGPAYATIGLNVLINPNSAWGTAPGSLWVSYADTGTPGTVSPPNTTIGTPTAIFYETLPVGTYFITLNIFADDTAGVYLEDATNLYGTLLKAPNPNQDSACSDAPIGCQPNENWLGSSVVNPNGTARLRIEAYQRGGGPFGVDYAGTASTVPEPGSALLLGGGILLIGVPRLLNRLRHKRCLN